MAGAYYEIPLGRDFSFTSNVANRVAELGTALANATLYFMAKDEPAIEEDADAIITITPTANTTTNVITVTIPRINTTLNQLYPTLFWEISMLSANSNLYYTLDQGRMAITQPVRLND